MNKKIVTSIFTVLITLGMYSTSICINKENKYCKDIWINNRSDDDIKIKVKDVEISEQAIKVNEEYKASAILTMNVENMGIDSVELSNIDIYPYQENKPIRYFVNTSKDNITGFIGNLQSGENKDIKIGLTLHNTNEKIKLVFSNIEDSSNKKVVESIKIK